MDGCVRIYLHITDFLTFFSFFGKIFCFILLTFFCLAFPKHGQFANLK